MNLQNPVVHERHEKHEQIHNAYHDQQPSPDGRVARHVQPIGLFASFRLTAKCLLTPFRDFRAFRG
jgi:hypothetical protein